MGTGHLSAGNRAGTGRTDQQRRGTCGGVTRLLCHPGDVFFSENDSSSMCFFPRKDVSTRSAS